MSDDIDRSLVLASASPRRADLLRQLGVDFRVEPADIEESLEPNESAHEFVSRLAADKAATVRTRLPTGSVVLAADTVVVCDGRVLGKPRDRSHAIEMLSLLSGRWHEVMTGVVIGAAEIEQFVVTTRVKFRELNDQEIAAYVSSGECFDKAGGYAIQGLGGALVEAIEGSYSNVVGLPLAETAVALNRFKVSHRLLV